MHDYVVRIRSVRARGPRSWCLGHRTPLDDRCAHCTWPLRSGGQCRARCRTRIRRTRQYAHQSSETLVIDTPARRLTPAVLRCVNNDWHHGCDVTSIAVCHCASICSRTLRHYPPSDPNYPHADRPRSPIIYANDRSGLSVSSTRTAAHPHRRHPHRRSPLRRHLRTRIRGACVPRMSPPTPLGTPLGAINCLHAH